MKDYERIRADISKRFKNEIQQLKLEIFNIQIENTELKVENVKLTNKIREYETQFSNISDSQKSLLGLTTAIGHLVERR